MIAGDIYVDGQGKEYYFHCMALPLYNRDGELDVADSNFRHFQKIDVALDMHTPEGKELVLYSSGEATYIESRHPHVVYQLESDIHHEETKVQAMRVDKFFRLFMELV